MAFVFTPGEYGSANTIPTSFYVARMKITQHYLGTNSVGALWNEMSSVATRTFADDLLYVLLSYLPSKVNHHLQP